MKLLDPSEHLRFLVFTPLQVETKLVNSVENLSQHGGRASLKVAVKL